MKRDRRLERFCKLKTVTNINFEDSRYLPVHNVTNITVCRKIFLVPKTSLSPNQSISNPIKESEMKFIVAAIILITLIRVEKADFEKFYTRKNINSVKKFRNPGYYHNHCRIFGLPYCSCKRRFFQL